MDINDIRIKLSRLCLPLNRLYFRSKWRPKTNKVVIGCGGFKDAGWVNTDTRQVMGGIVLDATLAGDWALYFEPESLTHILSEHVIEHLDDDQLIRMLTLCKRYLAVGGRLRLAVPDGNRKDETYAKAVAPPVDGHKQYFTADALQAILESLGFSVHRLEYHDEHGVFHKKHWDTADGLVRRSCDYDSQETFCIGDHCYTSLIVDAFKTQ